MDTYVIKVKKRHWQRPPVSIIFKDSTVCNLRQVNSYRKKSKHRKYYYFPVVANLEGEIVGQYQYHHKRKKRKYVLNKKYTLAYNKKRKIKRSKRKRINGTRYRLLKRPKLKFKRKRSKKKNTKHI